MAAQAQKPDVMPRTVRDLFPRLVATSAPVTAPTQTPEDKQELEMNDQVMRALLQQMENTKTGEYTSPAAGVSRQIVDSGGSGPNPALLLVVLVVIGGGYFLLRKKPKRNGGSTRVEE